MKRLSIFLAALFTVFFISNINPQVTLARNGNINNCVTARVDTSQSLKGTVVNATTGEAVTGATVQLSGQDQPVTTDSDGTFEISGISAGDYNITVTANGYKDFEGKVTVGGQMQPLSIKLTPK